MNFFNSILIFILRIFQLKTVHPVTKVGRIIFSAGGVGGIAISITTRIQGVPIWIDVDSSPGIIISMGLLVIGILIMLVGATLNIKMLKSAVIYLKGLPSMSLSAPVDSIRKPYSLYNPHSTVLTILDETPETSLKSINNDFRVLVSQVLSNGNYQKVFFAGLARIPCLFSVGTFFRGASANIEVLDLFRNSNGWKHLSELDTNDAPNIILLGDIDSALSSNNELGICLEITSEILMSELPEYIKNHSVRFKMLPDTKPEVFTSEPQLGKFCLEVKQFLDKASKKADVIHMFISAQSSVVFTLGRMYQEGMHAILVVHNYDPITKSYPWAFQVNKGAITLYCR